MIKKEKIILIASGFFLLLSMSIFIFYTIIIPTQVNEETKKVIERLNENKTIGFSVIKEKINKGTFIDIENYNEYLEKCSVISNCVIKYVTMEDVQEGFFIPNDLRKDQLLQKEHISNIDLDKDSRLYELRVENSLCDNICAGKYIDLYSKNGGSINCILRNKCLEGIYSFINDSYIEIEESKKKPDFYIILLRLTKEEYEKVSLFNKLYIRSIN